MIINLQSVSDALIALVAVVGIAVLFTAGMLTASALVTRDKARNARRGTPAVVPADIVTHPTQTDRVLELASR
jgi:hypothetical protein